MTTAGIEIQYLNVSRGGRPVVRDVSLSIEPGKITALLGANGAGKSSLVLAIAGIIPSASGVVKLAGNDLINKRPEVIRMAGIAAVPEGHQILTQLTVEENLLAAGSMHVKDELKKSVTTALAVFPELEARLSQRGGNLSGGQQQMLALAQALVSQPKYLLADELSLGLAPLIVSRLIHAVEEIAHSGVGVLLIEQFATIALSVAHRVYILDRGSIRFAGDPAEIKADPSILHTTYLTGSLPLSG